MIQRREIEKWCESVALEFRPEKILLFGSYARGTPTEDSDVDVLVVMPLPRGQRDVRQAAAIRERVRASFPMDRALTEAHSPQARPGRWIHC